MELTKVNSSNLNAIGYDPTTKKLRVEFRNSKDARMPGRVYEYANVSLDKHTALMGAESIGAHFSKHIKGHHPHKLIS